MQRNRSMSLTTLTTVLTVLVTVGSIQVAIADGFRNPPEGAAALGRAGTRLTEADDASTLTHNPANMMDLDGVTVMSSVTIGLAEKTYSAPSGASEDMDVVSFMPAIYAVAPLGEGKYRFGIGLNTPFGQANEWDERGMFTGSMPYYSAIKSMNVSPAFAVRLCDSLSLGVGANILWSSIELRQTMPWSGIAGDNVGPSSRATLEGDGVGFGARLGLTWSITERQRVALVYNSPISVECRGEFELDPMIPGLPPVLTAISDFETELDFPQIVSLGYGIQVSDAVRVEANVEWLEHSRFESAVLDVSNNNLLLQGFASADPVVMPQQWDDTWTFSLGADWDVTDYLTLRGGWIYLPTPVPDETISPASAETDANILAIGAELHSDSHLLALTYAPAINDDHDDAVGGSYEIDSHLFAASYSYSF